MGCAHTNKRRTETAILATNETTGHAFALDVLTVVVGRVLANTGLDPRLALAKLAVERFHLSGPELEMTLFCVFVATERNFG